MKEQGLKIVFMGTSDFAVPALEELLRADPKIAHVAAVVTQPDRVRGRGSKIKPTPVGAYAEANGLLLLKPERLKDNADFDRMLDEIAPNLIVVASYGKILTRKLLNFPQFGCINIHASLLPEYRGAAPVQRAILDGKSETGVTLMQMDEGLDTGSIIASARTAVDDLDAGELTSRLAWLGAVLLVEKLPEIAAGVTVLSPQDETRATYAEKITKEEAHIDLTKSAEEAVRRIRAMTPVPGAYVFREGVRISIIKADAIELAEVKQSSWAAAYESAAAGEALAVSKEGINIRTGEGVLVLRELKVPGKKAMPVTEYLKGNTFRVGETLMQGMEGE